MAYYGDTTNRSCGLSREKKKKKKTSRRKMDGDA